MGNTPYTRDDWNGLIDTVNEVLQSPPEDTDCEPIGEIPHVEPEHIWTKGDISTVQNALSQTCSEINFGTIPDLWKQSIIDEINSALGQAWCDCNDETECVTCPFPEHRFVYGHGVTGNPEFVIQCRDDGDRKCHFAVQLNGLEMGIAGKSGVIVSPYLNDSDVDPTHNGYGMGVAFACDCDGKVVVPDYLLSSPPPDTLPPGGRNGWCVASHVKVDHFEEIWHPPQWHEPWLFFPGWWDAGYYTYEPVYVTVPNNLVIYLECSTLCTPPGEIPGTPGLMKCPKPKT
jgi:hypothetical protein